MDIFVSAISQRPFHLYGIEYVYLLADPVLEARLTPADRRYFFLIPTVTDSTTTPASNFRGSGANHIFTVSIEASL